MKKVFLFIAVLAVSRANANGFTYNLKDRKMQKNGYAVSCKQTQNCFGVRGLWKAVSYAADNNIPCVGGWYNSNNGLYYYDATNILTDRQEAIAEGKKQKQIAIFDISNLEEILIK